MKYIIVGGVAGGMSAATRLRRLNEDAEIIVVEKGPYVSFANCGLPYYLAGEITDRSQLLVQTPEKLKARFNLDVRTNSEAIKIDSKNKSLDINNEGKTYTESYDKLILSPGAKPLVPDIKGISSADNIFTLRNLPDIDRIMDFVENKQPKTATVIGAGFIGLELTESLANRGIKVTIVEKATHVLPTIDTEMASFVQTELEKNNVTTITEKAAGEFKENGKQIILDDGSQIESDLTILSVGVKPDSTLAKTAGIKLGLKDGILVDDHYQTSEPDIYAVGDAIVVKQTTTKQDAVISLASPANRQGRQVADVISGLNRTNKGSLGTAIVRVFNIGAASTGLNEKQLQSLNYDYKVIHLEGSDHAGYYPGSQKMVLKVIFNGKTGKIYGAQAVGPNGMDKRIDIIATAIKAGVKVSDLPELEFSYAPPYGVAKDIVNMAGYIAENVLEGETDSIQWYELKDEMAAGAKLVDVRTPKEFAAGHMKGAFNVELDGIRDHLSKFSKDETYIISCKSGQRGYIAERILKQHGISCKNLDGAYDLYASVLGDEIVH
ncbi:FAD-dependent oxidoreductase [Companilactobacillus mishanensis]|uniref:FAD-dependent oxidoreductase n=1 Tax=Companilactobacillus mishanensis TaxID=2486008 RepID=UPI000F76BAF4|nr:FAD-dependent oxidoreductase [Companilactobacillus mishanensis]